MFKDKRITMVRTLVAALFLSLLTFMVPTLALCQTVVSVTPNPVKLQAGGKEAIITINGSGLDKLTSAKVILNNQQATEIQVLLGPISPTKLQVTLKASPKAIIGSNYQLQVAIGTSWVTLSPQVSRVEVIQGTTALKLDPLKVDPIK